MNVSFDVAPGTWATVSTNLGLVVDDQKEEGKEESPDFVESEDGQHGNNEDIVKSPVFVISRETSPGFLTFMCIDQRKDLLVWRKEVHNRFNPLGTIDAIIKSKLVQVRVTEVFLDCIPKKEELAILTEAEARRKGFLDKHPSMESCFFKLSSENNAQQKQ